MFSDRLLGCGRLHADCRVAWQRWLVGDSGWYYARVGSIAAWKTITVYCLERVLPRAKALMTGQAVLARSDSGFDSAPLLFQQDDGRAWAAAGLRQASTRLISEGY